jgi:hypothetical protein
MAFFQLADCKHQWCFSFVKDDGTKSLDSPLVASRPGLTCLVFGVVFYLGPSAISGGAGRTWKRQGTGSLVHLRIDFSPLRLCVASPDL